MVKCATMKTHHQSNALGGGILTLTGAPEETFGVKSFSGLCILRLTVRKINGVSVGRVTEIKLPSLVAGKDKWLLVDAKSILPNNISLESTTFKLNVDATSSVAESNENNNEVWHNL